MRIVIDRIEEGVAVAELENGEMVKLPTAIFDSVSEGDVFDIVKNEAEKEERMSAAQSLFDSLIKK